jgi:hypothetical protein
MKHYIVVPILTLLFLTPAFSQETSRVATETRISKQGATETGDRGLFTVPSVETLNQGQFSAGFGWSNIDRSPRDLDIASLPLFLSIGLHGRLSVSAALDTQRQITAGFLSQPGFNDMYPFVSRRYVKGPGDTIVSAKYRLQRRRDNVGGMSIRGSVKFPTAKEDKGLGTGATDVAADLIFTSLLPLRFLLDSAIGFNFTERATDPVTNTKRHIKDQIRSGIGLAWPSSGIKMGGSLQLIAEYTTLTFVGAGASNAAESVQNPSDVAAGVRYMLLGSGITLNAGYRTNTKFDFGFPGEKDRRGFTFSVSFTKPVRPPVDNRFPVVSLETSAEEVSAGSAVTITATGFDLDNDTLTYTWSASGRQVTGSGEKVTFSTDGLAPGRYTIRVTASDSKGGIATSLIDITVK